MASQRLSETFRQSKGENVSIGFSRKQSTCRKEQSRIVGSTGDNKDEWVLRQFDLTAKYGPCTNISRRQRWERADQLGLEPPQNVLHLLQQLETDPQKQLDLWANRI